LFALKTSIGSKDLGPVSNVYRADDPRDVIRPFLWVAALAFVTGFLGYLAIGIHRVIS